MKTRSAALLTIEIRKIIIPLVNSEKYLSDLSLKIKSKGDEMNIYYKLLIVIAWIISWLAFLGVAIYGSITQSFSAIPWITVCVLFAFIGLFINIGEFLKDK